MECIVEWMSHLTPTINNILRVPIGWTRNFTQKYSSKECSDVPPPLPPRRLWSFGPPCHDFHKAIPTHPCNTKLQRTYFIIFLCISAADFILTSSNFQHLHDTSGLSLSTGVSNMCLVIDGWQPLTADDSRCAHQYFRTSFASSHASAVCCLKVFVQRTEKSFLKRFAEDIDLAACSSSCNVSMEADLVDLTERRGDWSDYHKERTRFKSI